MRLISLPHFSPGDSPERMVRNLNQFAQDVAAALKNVPAATVVRTTAAGVSANLTELDARYLRRADGAQYLRIRDAILTHGGFPDLADDDHPQYFLADGLRQLTGDLDILTGKVVKIDSKQVVGEQGVYVEDAATDASEAHSVASWAEVEAALNALGAKINAVATTVNEINNRIKTHGLISSTPTWTLNDARAMVTLGLVNPDATTYAVGLTTHGMWDKQ